MNQSTADQFSDSDVDDWFEEEEEALEEEPQPTIDPAKKYLITQLDPQAS